MAKRGRPKKIVDEAGIDSNNKKDKISDEIKIDKPEPTSVPLDPEKEARAKKVANQLSKQFGFSVVHYGTTKTERSKLPFNVEQIDKLYGGGLPTGLFHVIWGGNSSGKTTSAYHLISEVQKSGKSVLYVDLEHSLEHGKQWATACGVDLTKLMIADTLETAEQVMDLIIKMSKEKAVDLIIIDSLHGLSPKGEQETKAGKEKSMEDDTMGLLPKKLAEFFRKSSPNVYKGDVTILLIGQTRTHLGFIAFEELTCGNALSHWASTITRFMRGSKSDSPKYRISYKTKRGKTKTKEIIIGYLMRLVLEKTKIDGTAPERTEISLPFYNRNRFNKPTDEEIEDIYGDYIVGAIQNDEEDEE